MAHWDSNGHVTGDVTWPSKVKVVTSIYLGPNISKTAGDRDLVQWTTNRKWPIGIRMVTWPMTSRDPERSRSWRQYIWGPLSRQRLEIRTWCQWSTYRKWLSGNQMVTWPMTSRDPERWAHYPDDGTLCSNSWSCSWYSTCNACL